MRHLSETRNVGAWVSGAIALALLARPALSWAKPVKIEWKAIAGAVQYELEVRDQGDRVVGSAKSAEKSWKGDLQPGLYSYQLRGYDWIKRPGKWSAPKALVVMPPAPELIAPKSNETIRIYGTFGATTLKWRAPFAASKYRVEVKREGKSVFSSLVVGDSVRLPKLQPGEYEWSVAPVMEAKASRTLASAVPGKNWEGKADDELSFEVERLELKAPAPVAPQGVVRPPADGKLFFEWKPVEGASSYRLQLYREKGEGRGPASGVSLMQNVEVKDPRALLRAPAEGSYQWRVVALAKPEAEGAVGATSQGSLSSFQIDRNAVFVDGTGYFAGSMMLSPYTYRSVSPLAGRQFSASASAAVLRVSGEYWVWPRIGFAAAAENTSFTIDDYTYNRAAAELHAKYRMKIDEGQFGWFLAPKAGIEFRNYFHLIWSGAGKTTASMTRTLAQYSTVGPSVGFDIRKQFTEKWSVGGKFAYFIPMTLSGGSGGAVLTKDASRRNLSFGIQGLYWLKKEWSLAAGVYLDKRSISFQPPSTSAPEMIYTDGTYFFGSVIYSFGRGK